MSSDELQKRASRRQKLRKDRDIGFEDVVFHIEHTVFLMMIIPSRKATKEYRGEETDDEA